MAYGRLTKFVLDQVGGKIENIKDFRFWFQLETYEPLGFLGLSSNTGNFKMMLCRFDVDDKDESHLLGGEYDYKARIIPVDDAYNYSKRLTYADDILSEFKSGYAISYKDGDHLVEDIKYIRNLTGGFYEVFSGDILLDADGKIKWGEMSDDAAISI